MANWDRVAELLNLLNTFGRDSDFSKADHQASYRQIPLKAPHAKQAVSPLRSPTDNRLYGSISRTMVFGDVASVLRYNVFSRLIADLFAKLFGIPILSFFDDFGSI